jgi:hypothetical protein
MRSLVLRMMIDGVHIMDASCSQVAIAGSRLQAFEEQANKHEQEKATLREHIARVRYLHAVSITTSYCTKPLTLLQHRRARSCDVVFPTSCLCCLADRGAACCAA